MFVIYTCGCVGLPIDGKSAIVVKACDEDRDASADSLSWFHRDVGDKTFMAVEPERARKLHQQLAVRLAMADRFEDVQRALGIPKEVR